MTYHSLGVAALLGFILLTTACSEEDQDQLLVTIEPGQTNDPVNNDVLEDSSNNVDSDNDNQNSVDDSANDPIDMGDNNTDSVLTAAELRFPLANSIIGHDTIVIVPSHDDAELWLDVGTTEKGEDLFNQVITGATQVNHIPLNGQPIFITLWTRIQGEWQFKSYQFQTEDKTPKDNDSEGGADSGSADQSGDESNPSNGGELKSVTEILGFDGNYIVKAGEEITGQLEVLDINNRDLVYEITAQPSHGSVQLDSASGAFTYQANNQAIGTEDAFAYRVFDGEIYSVPAMVRINYSAHSGVTLQGRSDGIGADLVIVAEGFTEGDMPWFHHAVDEYIEFMFGYEGEFHFHKNAWNIHRVDLISQQNGSDSNYEVDTKNTALDSGFNCSNIQRLLCVNTAKTFDVVNSTFPQWDNILVIVNSSTYGGAGYSSGIGTVSLSNSARDVALHEMAHSFAGLGDEYTYGGSGAPSREPSDANLTINNNLDTVKWAHWIGTDNVGLYEGGRYVSNGVWRPTSNSMMRSLGQPFYAVNKEAWTLAVYEHGGVVLNRLPSQAEVLQKKGQNTQFYIEPLMNRGGQNIRWFVNGQALSEFNDHVQITLGDDQEDSYEVSVKLSDATGVIRKDANNHSSDEVRWSVNVQ